MGRQKKPIENYYQTFTEAGLYDEMARLFAVGLTRDEVMKALGFQCRDTMRYHARKIGLAISEHAHPTVGRMSVAKVVKLLKECPNRQAVAELLGVSLPAIDRALERYDEWLKTRGAMGVIG
ncbi:hypothetical protein UFOVP380_4 [uncultured Caudovirales phage]|uniref:Uncharacterized protein n=1 Tax=uncultured Caudovirales phage TaxID=2100421 RepID=A0A6J7WYR7_9CAUD|nr:hypothetical protein UFOVP380_4 [uncultured Caudovirales phage]